MTTFESSGPIEGRYFVGAQSSAEERTLEKSLVRLRRQFDLVHWVCDLNISLRIRISVTSSREVEHRGNYMGGGERTDQETDCDISFVQIDEKSLNWLCLTLVDLQQRKQKRARRSAGRAWREACLQPGTRGDSSQSTESSRSVGWTRASDSASKS